MKIFCMNIHLRTIRAVATRCWRQQHRPGHLNDCAEGRLEKSCGPLVPPPHSIESSDQKKAYIVSLPSFPFSFLEIGWLYQNGILLLDSVLQMIII